MRFGLRAGPAAGGFPLTPMIDVIFLLLVVFATAAIFAQAETEFSIELPVSSESVAPSREFTQIIVNVTREGRIIVNQRELTLEELGAMLRRVQELYPDAAAVQIWGDAAMSYQTLVDVLDECARADIWRISFAMSEREEPR